jgi:hypothetical protein
MKAFRFLDVHPALRTMQDAVCLVVIPYSIGKTTAWQILNSLAVTAFAIKFFAISNTVSPLAFRAIISPPGVLWEYYIHNDLEMELDNGRFNEGNGDIEGSRRRSEKRTP